MLVFISFRGSMPPDPPRTFLVFQSASTLFGQKQLRLKKKSENYALPRPLKFLATPLVAVALAFKPRFEIPKAKIVFTPMTSNLEFTASLFDAEHYGDCMENKPTGLSVVPLEKALGGIFAS